MTLRLQPTLTGELEITVLDADGLSDEEITDALAELILAEAADYVEDCAASGR